MKKNRIYWAYEGPVNLDNHRHSMDFRAYTIAASCKEAERNIIWQYKVCFNLKSNANVSLDGILYQAPRNSRPLNTRSKEKVRYDYEQLEMSI